MMKTDQMQVNSKGIDADIHRRSRETSSDQYIRELWVNSYQACERDIQNNKLDLSKRFICIEPNWSLLKTNSSPKFCIWDTGEGFKSNDDVKKSLTMLGSHDASFSENFGIGGKISTLIHNPIGVSYNTIARNGYNCDWTIYRDLSKIASGNSFCIKPNDETEDGYGSVDIDEIPEDIRNHGTMVTLLGKKENENTFSPNGEKHKYHHEYLSCKFYDWDRRIESRIWNLNNSQESFPVSPYEKNSNGQAKGQYRTMVPLKENLHDKEFCLFKEVISTGLADVEIIVRHEKFKNLKTLWPCEGATFCPFIQGSLVEIYNFKTDYQHRSFLRNCRIPVLHNRITMIINWRVPVQPTSARDTLKMMGKNEECSFDLPWDDLAFQISNNMPSRIKDLINKELSKTDSLNENDTEEKLLAYFKELGLEIGFSGRSKKSQNSLEKSLFSYEKNNESSPVKSGLIGPSRSKISSVPRFMWDPENDMDELNGRIAYYDNNSNIVWMNSEFKFLKELISSQIEIYGVSSEEEVKYITSICRKASEFNIGAGIGMIASLRPSESWSPDDKEEAWSPYSLTNGFCSSLKSIKDSISQSLKSKFKKKEEVVEIVDLEIKQMPVLINN